MSVFIWLAKVFLYLLNGHKSVINLCMSLIIIKFSVGYKTIALWNVIYTTVLRNGKTRLSVSH